MSFPAKTQSQPESVPGFAARKAAVAILSDVLRRKRPELPRPYKVFAYPFIPLLFLIVAIFFLIFIAVGDPRNSGFGVLVIVSGIPLFVFLRRRQRTGQVDSAVTRVEP